MARFRAACVQVNAGREFAANIEAACRFIRHAREQGADLVCLPENVSLLEPVTSRLKALALPEDEHPALKAFTGLAKESGAWILIGSLAIRSENGLIANRSFLLDDTGAIAARYDKIHLFDVDIGPGQQYRESDTFTPGTQPVVVQTPWGGLGLSICYDLRFPALYRRLAQTGADCLCVPAAFTRTTGEAHWHVLLRARAIENGCFVFAPAQCGTHAEGRQTFGHSLIIDPWGTVLADGGEGPGIIIADVDTDNVTAARRRVPALYHERPLHDS
ncbi:MAG: carbon-nitrogen hydrolase family protein [Hyphomicrobiales bacterium]|nr:carbon-nitrogen hydrolase family protein [Hyphomicrobiales bacterium]